MRMASVTTLPKNAFALFESAIEHGLNRLSNEPHLFFNYRVVVVCVPREMHGLAEPEPVLGRKRKLPSRYEELGDDRKRRHSQQPGEPIEVGDRDVLFLAADDRNGHNGRICLDRESHEAKAKVCQLVTAARRLFDSALPLPQKQKSLSFCPNTPRVFSSRPPTPHSADKSAKHNTEHGPPPH